MSVAGQDRERRKGGPQRGRPSRGGSATSRSDRQPARGSTPARGRPNRGQPERTREEGQRDRSETQARYDGPPLDDSITGRELDRSVSQQLQSLPEKLALRIARHLVAAGQVIDTDPRLAFEHTLAARARAARVAVVREACGEAAYAAEEFGDALAELRAARRMNGNNDYLPLMADCERALGRPERALALAKSPAVQRLDPALRVEMTIVEAGARRDVGEVDAALRTLEAAPIRSKSRAEWLVRLRYAYADTLLAAGRTSDALVWFHRTVGVDADGFTDASARLADLEGLVLVDTAAAGDGAPGVLDRAGVDPVDGL